ncbi:MAG: sigma factor [Myxococcota bacterium]
MQSPSFFESGDDPTAKDEPELRGLFVEFAPRVPRAAARTMRRWGLPESVRDDLVSTGYLGLWKALKNLRGDAHEFELSAYVSRRIEGAVIDEARTLIGRSPELRRLLWEAVETSPQRGIGGEGTGPPGLPSRAHAVVPAAIRVRRVAIQGGPISDSHCAPIDAIWG